MKWLTKARSWPDDKKKTFAISAAAAGTVIIAGLWLVLRPPGDLLGGGNAENDRAMETINQSVSDISNRVEEVKGQIFGTTTEESTSSDLAATSAEAEGGATGTEGNNL